MIVSIIFASSEVGLMASSFETSEAHELLYVLVFVIVFTSASTILNCVDKRRLHKRMTVAKAKHS